jgi:transcription-repair coupling factor (superfamily II helicase)
MTWPGQCSKTRPRATRYKATPFSGNTVAGRVRGRLPRSETPGPTARDEEIKRDMESARPMDRLICGDVG